MPNAPQPTATTATWANLGPPAGFGGEYSTITGLKHGPILIQASQEEANLIAAAPELLAALKVMLRDYKAAYDGIGDLEMQPAIFQASAAVAKAQGGAA